MLNNFITQTAEFRKQGERYLTVVRPLLTKLISLYPVRLVVILIGGISAFVLQLAAIWLIFNAVGNTDSLKPLFGLVTDQSMTKLQLMSLGLTAGLILLVANALAVYLFQTLSVFTARDYSQICLADLLQLLTVKSRKARWTDFSAAAMRLPIIDLPGIQQISHMHRALDVFARISMVTSPRVVSAIIGFFVLSWLNITATLSLIPVVLAQGLIVYWQSRRGLASRSRLEQTISEATAERGRLLRNFSEHKTQDAPNTEVEKAVDRVVYGRAGKTIAHEFAFQFAILYESNFTSKLVAVVALSTVAAVHWMQSPLDTTLISPTFWLAAGFYIVVLRFVFSELEGVMRAIVAINRLFAHLSSYFDVQFHQPSNKNVPLSHLREQPPQVDGATLTIDAGTWEIDSSTISSLTKTFGKRAEFIEKLNFGQFGLDLGQAAIMVVPHSMMQLNPERYRKNLWFNSTTNFTRPEQHCLKCYWRTTQSNQEKQTPRMIFDLPEGINRKLIERFVKEIGAPQNVRQLMVRDLDAPLCKTEQAKFRGFHGFLFDVVYGIYSPQRLLFVELSMMDQIVRDMGTECFSKLQAMLSEKIVMYVHYRAKENELAASMKLPCVLFGQSNSMGWLPKRQIPDFEVYRTLIENERHESYSKIRPDGYFDATTDEISLL